MKRLISTALAFSLIGATALQAEPFRFSGRNHGSYGQQGHFDRGRDFDRRHHHHHNDDAGTAIAVGVGLIALTAILAAQADRDSSREADYERYAPPPPPPEDANRYEGRRYEEPRGGYDPSYPENRDNGPY